MWRWGSEDGWGQMVKSCLSNWGTSGFILEAGGSGGCERLVRPGRLAVRGGRQIICWNRRGRYKSYTRWRWQALGTGDQGGGGGWEWLRFLAGPALLLSHGNEGERSPRGQGPRGRCFAGVGRGPFQKDPEISGGTAGGNVLRSCSAAADDLRIEVCVGIKSFARTNIHPKINFPFFLFL